jgi:polar amino acid transport system permease protein
MAAEEKSKNNTASDFDRREPAWGILFRMPWWLIVMATLWFIAIISIILDPDYNSIFIQITEGIGLTLALALSAYAIGILIGLVVGLVRSYRPKPPDGKLNGRRVLTHVLHAGIYHLLTIYVEFMRGIPSLVFLLMCGFVIVPLLRDWLNMNLIPILLPLIRLWDPEFTEIVWRGRDAATGIVGLGLVYGAYLSEVFRSGIQSIAKGQMEAAKSLGMTWLQAMLYIILPQAIRRILPELGNNFIAMIKDTSLVTILGTEEITQIARKTSSSNFLYTQTYAVLSLIYLTVTVLGSLAVQGIEGYLKTETTEKQKRFPYRIRLIPRIWQMIWQGIRSRTKELQE